jgi:hypothetical protein
MMKKPASPPKQELSDDDDSSSIDKFIMEIRANDVLLGRGAGPNEHTGNITFRVIVAKQKAVYMATTNRQEKNKIALKTMRIVKAQKGRFLQKVKDSEANDDVYEIADDKVVLEKIKQALRHLDRARTPKSDARKVQETIKVSRPALSQQGGGVGSPPAAQKVGPLLNAYFLQDARSIAQRRSAAFAIRENDFSDLPIVSPQESLYSQLSAARGINAEAASLAIHQQQQAGIPNRSGLVPTSTIDNLRHLEFKQGQLNTALAASHQGRERENQYVANTIALIDARNSADNTLWGSILREEYGGLSAIRRSGPGINHLMLPPVSSPFPTQRGPTTGLMPSTLDQFSRRMGVNRGNPAGSYPVKSLERMLNFSGGNGRQSSSFQPTAASSYLSNQQSRGLLQQRGQHQAAGVAALRDSSARLMEALALLGKKPVDAPNGFDRVL